MDQQSCSTPFFTPVKKAVSITVSVAAYLALFLMWSPAVSAQTITTLAGNGTRGFSGDAGPASSADLALPGAVVLDTKSNAFIADSWNNRIRRVDAVTGIITTVAGNGAFGYSGDGGPATAAALAYPSAVAVDGSGNLFIADTLNNRIRKVVLATGIITTVAGNGSPFFSGDGGAATKAAIGAPFGVAVDGSGNLFIVDTFQCRIRRVDAGSGIISTVAGNGTFGYAGDSGPATSARLAFPHAVGLDAAGNLFIADTLNNRVRRVDASTGIISTVAGDGATGFSGDGGQATLASLYAPLSVEPDAGGNLFISDAANDRVRKVNASTGTITTVAGNGSFGFSGDGGPASSASLNLPVGLGLDLYKGNLLISDSLNNRVRQIDGIVVPLSPLSPLISELIATINSMNLGSQVSNVLLGYVELIPTTPLQPPGFYSAPLQNIDNLSASIQGYEGSGVITPAEADQLNQQILQVSRVLFPIGTLTQMTITNFSFTNVTQTTALISWNTNLPSTTQVFYALYPSTTYMATTEDFGLTTSHSVTLTGLTPRGYYSVYGISTFVQTIQSPVLNFGTLY